MAGEKLFDTFQEEHMENPSLLRYNTGARAHQHSAHNIQHHAPRVFHPIMLTNIQGCHIAHQHTIRQIPMANAVINQDTGTSLEYRQLIQDDATFPIWNKSVANDFGRLSQGVGGRIEGYNTMFFIHHQSTPKGKVVNYVHFVVDICPNKPKVHRVRLTGGGNLIHYPGDVYTHSAYLTT
jgi:hypothetical protein